MRLRQVALVARELGPVADRLRRDLGLGEPYRDPGVGAFGLENAVFAVGDTFLEVVAPVRSDTTAGRYLAKHGGDGGYMAIFQLPELTAARRRVADLGVRIVWSADLPDIAGTHLHPKDVPGAIVSLDWAEPWSSWRWAGPSWVGQVTDRPSGGLRGLTISVDDPSAVGRRWADVLGVEIESDAGASLLHLDDGRQVLRFSLRANGGSEGISEVLLDTPAVGESQHPVEIGGVRFVFVAATSIEEEHS